MLKMAFYYSNTMFLRTLHIQLPKRRSPLLFICNLAPCALDVPNILYCAKTNKLRATEVEEKWKCFEVT